MEFTELDFIQGWEEGRLNLNIPQDADYRQACEFGRQSFQAYLYYLLHSEYQGGDLQHITASLEDLPDSEAKNGFRVGFYSAVEAQLRRSIVAMHQLQLLQDQHGLNAKLDYINTRLHRMNRTAGTWKKEVQQMQAYADQMQAMTKSLMNDLEQLEGAEK